MRDEELAAVQDVLDRTLADVKLWLAAGSMYLQSQARAGDELARIISERLEAAFDEMTVEAIGARTVLEDREN